VGERARGARAVAEHVGVHAAIISVAFAGDDAAGCIRSPIRCGNDAKADEACVP
jgi:hypothetical protein